MSLMKIFAVFFITCILSGCGYQYKQFADSSMEGKRIQGESFAVFPMEQVHFSAPSGCMGPTSKYDPISAARKWDYKIQKKLVEKFPNQKWHFIDPKDRFFQKESCNLTYIRSLAEEKTATQIISRMETSHLQYVPLPKSNQLALILKQLHDSLQVNYAVMFVRPILSGEVQHNYHHGPNGGLFSSQTYYTGDIQIQVWDCRDGQLVYNSGAWQKSGGFCFFISPEDMAMTNAADDLAKKLLSVIEVIIKYRLQEKYAFR